MWSTLCALCPSMWTLFLAVTLCIVAEIFVILWRFLNVDKQTKAYGGFLVAETLRKHGVKEIFTLVGGHVSPILAAAEKIGIKVIDTRIEASAVFAADAAGRLTGNIGVAVVTAGPGVTNTITAVKNAQMAESPVLLIGGAAAGILKGRGALQDVDQLSIMQTACKFSATVKAVKDIIPVLKKAIYIARSGVPGPVFVEFPIDVLYPYFTVRQEMLGNTKPTTFRGRIMQWYLEYYLSTVFHSAWEKRDTSPLEVLTPMPDPILVEKAAGLLVDAKRPVFIIGSQAMLLPKEISELQRCLTVLGVPTYLGGMARGLLGPNCPIQMRHSRREALREADFILLAGVVCDFRLNYGRSLSRKAVTVSVNRDYYKATLNAGTFWNPTLTVLGDSAMFLVNFTSLLYGYRCNPVWLSRLSKRDELKEEQNKLLALETVGEHLNPMGLLYQLDSVLPDSSIIIVDGGDFVGTAAYILRPRGPLSWLDPGAFGTLGVGGGFAIAAKVLFPKSQVWIIYGDGSCGYSVVEFDAFVRHKLPVLALVGNDAGWTQIERTQRPMFGTSVACILAHTQYHVVARGFGAEGLLSSQYAHMPPKVFIDAQMMNNTGQSVLINALIGKTLFRAESISV